MPKKRRYYEKLEPLHFIAYGEYTPFKPKQLDFWGNKVDVPKVVKKPRKRR